MTRRGNLDAVLTSNIFAQVAALKCGTAYLLLETQDIKYLWTLHNIPDNRSIEMLHALSLLDS
jgi:hypothetical protein